MKRALSFLLFVGLTASAAAAVEFIHNPVLTAPAGQAINISTMLSGANGSIQVRLYYRVKGTDIYSSVVMAGSSSSVSGQIPASAVDTAGVEYYIQATLSGQPNVTSPSTNPTVSPYFITVHRDTSKPSLTILSPMEGDTLQSSRPVITVSYENGDLGIDPSSVILEIDGKKIKDSGQLQAFQTLMSYVPSDDLSQGSHSVEVSVKNSSGTQGSIQWSFTIDSMGGGTNKAGAFHWDGHAGYETLYGLVTQQNTYQTTPLPYRPYGANRVDVEVNGRGPEDTYQLKVYATDEDRMDQQATDRFTGLIQNDEGLIVLGDYSPTFSELSMYQPLNVRGLTVDLRDGDLADGHTRLMGVAGQTYRTVPQGEDAFTNGTQAGTYAQYLYGTRWEAGDKYFLMGFNVVSVDDDQGSLSQDQAGTTQPQYTSVATADARVQIPQIYLKMSGETGADYDFNGPTILGANAGSAYMADADWNILPWGTHATFDWKDLGGGFGFVPGGFNTMANPGLISDYKGYEAGFSQVAFSNQLSFSFNANGWRDNLQNESFLSTDYKDFLSGSITIAPKGLPFINAGYSLLMDNNHLTQLYVDSTGNSVTPTDNNTGNLSLGMGYAKALGAQTQLTLNIGLQQLMVTDELGGGLRSTQNLDTTTYMASALLSIGSSNFSLAGAFGNTTEGGYDASQSAYSAPAPSGNANTDSVSVSWLQPWLPGVFNTHLGYDLSISNQSFDATSTQASSISDATRGTYSLGADYTLAKVHLFSLAFGYSAVTVTQALGSVSSPDANSMLLTDASYRWTF